MTEGNIWKQLIIYAIPLLLGNLLQQLYNAFDAIVVGNFVGNEALAAVGATGPMINMIIAFFMGMSTGASVLISQAYGARDQASLQDTVHTSMLLSVILGLVLGGIGVVLTPFLLEWMSTPIEIIDDATTYLQIYFVGMVSLTVYNMGAAILRAVGDSKRPLYFLMVSTVLNIIGNLIFVIVFKMGIAGVAWNTVLSQVVSAVLVIIVLCRAQTEYKLYFHRLGMKMSVVRRITAIGLPGGIQQAIISFSNIAVQAYINGLGATVVAGYSASTKLDAFITLPPQTMGMAVTTFVGQNLGAHKVARARRGTRNSLIMGIAITVALSILALVFGRQGLRLFSPDEAVLTAGYEFMKAFVPFYFILCLTQIIPGSLRGAGDVRVATATCIVSFVVLRQIYLYFITQVNYTIFPVGFSYPATWAIAAIVLCIYYKRTNWDRFAEPAVPVEPEADKT
jgi:putative MATE family efflux protein